MTSSFSRGTHGFSLLEVLLAALVLMIGVMAVSQLSRSLFAGLDPSQPHGLNQHPAIVENLLRDQIERARELPNTALPSNVGALVTPHGTYTTSMALAALPIVAPQSLGVTVTRRRYVATVRYQAAGAATSVIAGQVVFDKVSGLVGRSGL